MTTSEEEDIVIELATRLTEFFQEAMVESGLSRSKVEEVTRRVMLKQIDDISSDYAFLEALD